MCKFDFNCHRPGCVFRHSNTSILYVPGEDKRKEKNDNIDLLKYFIDAQGGGRTVKLSFFAKDGKASANIESQPSQNTINNKNIETATSDETRQFVPTKPPQFASAKTPQFIPRAFELPSYTHSVMSFS